jgi:hypothetical protein
VNYEFLSINSEILTFFNLLLPNLSESIALHLFARYQIHQILPLLVVDVLPIKFLDRTREQHHLVSVLSHPRHRVVV